MKILLVDDEDVLRQFVALLLQLEGHFVAEASNGPEAIRRIQKEHFDVIVSDHDMPGGENGLEVLRHSWERHKKQRRILLTGNEDLSIRRVAPQIGASVQMKPRTGEEMDLFLQEFEKKVGI
jgi:CheY-like chemotaxis protein